MSAVEGPCFNRPVFAGGPSLLVTFHPAADMSLGNHCHIGAEWGVTSNHAPGLHRAEALISVRTGSLGTHIGLGWGRQNERDRVMVENPLNDFEEVIV